MNQINDPPNDYKFGTEFNYAVWTANTDITLTNVPWNNDYRDVVGFQTTDELNEYINRRALQNTTIKNATYAKANQPIMLDIPFNQANRFNYVRVYNPAQPVSPADTPKYFYYFIVDVQYIAPNTTSIVVQLDVYQTYIRLVKFGRCYVERGHLGIANENAFQNYGRDYLSVPEGLDTGSEYLVVDRYLHQIMSMANKGPVSTPTGSTTFVGNSVLICTTLDLEASPGTQEDPNIRSARGGPALGTVSGASFYIFRTVYEFQQFMSNYSKYPWVTQSIISINLIPDYRRYYGSGAIGARLPFGGYRAPAGKPTAFATSLVKTGSDFRRKSSINNYIPPRYRHLDKFRTFPYMAIRISSNTGQQIILQPEHWNSKSGLFREGASLMPPNARITLIPLGYNSTNYTESINGSVEGDGMDRMVSISGLPTLPIVNDGAILYMAQNANSIPFGFQSANWSQTRALRSNEVSYDQATAGINAGIDQSLLGQGTDVASTQLGNQYATDVTQFNAARGIISGAIGGAAGGGGKGGAGGIAAGAIAGAGGGVMDALWNQQANSMAIGNNNSNLAIRLSQAGGSASISAGLAGNVRDSNKALSDWAARGDYENTVAGLNAKIQDAQLSPPSLAGQAGGEYMNLLLDRMEYRLEILMPDQATLQGIGEYWLRYGYAVNRFAFVPNDLQVMDKFTYWKMKETYIRSAGMPETFKQAIRGIFEKGVTVWANPDEIGMIDPAVNKPIPGIIIDGYVPPETEPEPEPEPPATTKRKRHKMLVFSTIDDNPATPGSVWALAGSSPGTDANFIETRDSLRAEAFMQACGVEVPVGVTPLEFAEYKALYQSPVSTAEIPPEVG